jgi:hypothetical protein
MRLGGPVVALMLVACAEETPRRTTRIEDIMGSIDASSPLDAAAVVASDARVSASWLGCPAMWEECPSGEPWRVIAQASRFGSGASFRALAGDLVLVQGGSAAWRVVRVGPDLTPGEPSVVHSVAFPPGEWDARGLARTQGIAVIACAERCVLLESALDGDALRATPGSELPQGYQVRGLQASDGMLCVFGSDLSCFSDGRWQRALDEEVVSLSLGWRGVALTRSGRVFASSSGSWLEEAAVSGFTSVAAAGKRTLFSSDGSWLERTDGQDHACEVPDGIAAVLVAFGVSPSLLTGRGDLLSVRSNGFCRTQQVSVRDVLAASSGPCTGEPRVITASQLIGDNRCDLE